MTKRLQFVDATNIQTIDSDKNDVVFDCNIYAGQPFTVRTNNGCYSQISITNLSGIQSYTGSLTNDQAVCKVNNPGLYVLAVKNGTSISTTKIVVK